MLLPRDGTAREFAGQFMAQALRLRECGGRDDLTRQCEPGAASLSMDSVPQTVGFPQNQQLDPCPVYPNTRGSPDCDRAGLPRLQVLRILCQTRELSWSRES